MIYETTQQKAMPASAKPGVQKTKSVLQPTLNPLLVKWVQQALNRILKTKIPVSGKKDQGTMLMIKHLQRKLGIQPDGRITATFVNRLRGILAKRSGRTKVLTKDRRTKTRTGPQQATVAKPAAKPAATPAATPAAKPVVTPTVTGVNRNISPSQPTLSQGSTPCNACGCTHSICDVISGFAINKTVLSPTHIARIQLLAKKIIEAQINGVIATGHTDASGSKPNNFKLGRRRSFAVINELLKQLDLLKPGYLNKIFFRMSSKGETRPVSQNPADNRRVEICLKKVIVV